MLPPASPGGGRRRWTTGEASPSEKRPRDPEDSEPGSSSDDDSGSGSDGDFVSDLREIVCLLRLIKGGANKDGQKKCAQIITSVAEDIQAMIEDAKLKFEKERQNFLKVLSNTSKEQCESSLSREYIKFQETYEMFCKEKDEHVQAFRGKEEMATLSELDNTFSEKITYTEQSLRRLKHAGKSFIVLRKSVGSFLECGSDDDFDLDDD
ncbi:hypothetical protein GUJ93_ZPchr0007g3386 [Zizania palustris]|uniref:Uncharacterized protein n=1 Tax=Zizania palustris TaxID=103762 RepID=A0A8J5TEW1_ZIZPA|nr:hypothetical protein GUJ93_ZPchr0007g3386 [Zizania palustris]